MSISASMVKELREKTGAGMMDCKKALSETNGDMEKAIEYLREKGLATAAKKSSRIAAEGLVQAYLHNDAKIGVLVEVNCETDFVAKTDEFKELVRDLAEHIAVKNPTLENIAEQAFLKNESITVGQLITERIAKIGENIVIRRFVRYEVTGAGLVQDYIHFGGRIGVLVELATDSEALVANPAFKALAHDIAMHSAAANPKYLVREEISAEVMEKEREIYEQLAKNEGKPEKAIPKIVEGRVNKFYAENCLVEQAFVKDPDKSIKTLVAEKAKELGGKIELKAFTRLELGEGIEKKKDDFVAEVMKEVNK